MGEEILPPYEIRVIEQVKFTFCLLGKALEKQTKTIVNQWNTQKQVQALQVLKPAEHKQKPKTMEGLFQ